MSRPATSRLKVNPPLGRMPVLQYLLPAQLEIDETYQRSLEAGGSQALIRRIAQFWNWDLCQPLVVARRDDGRLFVIDGQHRLEAAKLRGDIHQLPAVVVQYSSAADEAASFVHLNQQRRPLNKLEIFKAALASGDPEATAIVAAMTSAGLSVAPHGNFVSWKPGMVSNIGGIENAWRRHGPVIATDSMRALVQAYPNEKLQLAGTVYSGIVAVRAKIVGMNEEWFAKLVALVRSKTQREWRAAGMLARAADPNLRAADAAGAAMLALWDPPAPKVVEHPAARPDFAPPSSEKRWCDQCDRSVHLSAATLCRDRFCKLRPRLTA